MNPIPYCLNIHPGETLGAVRKAITRHALAVKARVAIEAGLPLGWRELVGDAGEIVGVSDFGASAPGEEVLARYGFTTENVVAAAERSLARA